MTKDPHLMIITCLRMILRPIVKFCLSRSLGLQDLTEAARVVFLEVAKEGLEKQNEKVTVSRLNAITGVDRRAAVRILREGEIKDSATQYATRVIGQWRRDRRFLTSSGKPKVLSCEGDNSEFHQLVRLISSSIHPKSVLFDLERVGAVEHTKAGLKLRAKAYIPKGDPVEGFRMLGEDTEDLLTAVIDNIYTVEDPLPNYHCAAVFNNIPESDLPLIREWLYRACSKLHIRGEHFLAKHDLDFNPNSKKDGGRRVSFGIYTRTT